MAQPVWITPAGSLGVIPEGIFYQETLRASTPPLENTPVCTAASATTNLITCASTAGITAGLNVMFSGTTFGGVDEYTRYFVFQVVNATQFSICATEFSTSSIALTNGTGQMTATFTEHVLYNLIAGQLPEGVQVADNGIIVGVPLAVASLQGVPTDVSQDITSKFTIRAYTRTVPLQIRDRTFTLTITGNDVPEFITPSGPLSTYNSITGQWVVADTYYDGGEINYQIEYTNQDAADTVVVTLVSGELPGGVEITPTGLITGYIEPAANINEVSGYDVTPIYSEPYDFIISTVSRNYQFTLEVTDGKSSNLRTFEFFVYDRSSLTADNTTITADTTAVTADEGLERAPFLLNAVPSNLGIVRSDNYYAYQFIGRDYDTPDIRYAIGVNQGAGLPPGLELDTITGWYYGYLPDQGVTSVEYSFNIVAYQADFVGSPITCTATTFGTNRITCNSTEQIGPGQPIIFTGTTFGGVSASATQVYYVLSVVNSTQFTITTNLSSTTPVSLSTSAGSMTANLVVASKPYPFTITLSGAVDAEVTWLTDSNLGVIVNGEVSLFQVEAVNRGGRELTYRLKDGAFNELPQGLQLLPTGEISGRASFNTFAIDLGSTTIDNNSTTWDSSFTFTVNAYAEDTQQIVYDVESITVVDGGSGYSSITTPVIEFSTPIGATAVQALAGNVTVSGGAITSIDIADPGAGYTGATGQSGSATVEVIAGFGGSGAELQAVMRPTGVKDVVSVFKTFTIRLIREYNAPYQNLIVQAMPPLNDRLLIDSLLTNNNIFVPDYIFRPTDPYFGKSTRVNYDHAYGLAPDILDRYVESLYENHYWKNLVLGEISTAQATDASGNVIYEVVYSNIIDNLVNDAGESVSKIVNLAYPIIDPNDGSTVLTQVYPNSLIDMRNQVIDVVGQISSSLPLWMTSKQSDGRVLGFTPAWVLCYTKPGRSRQIAYYIQSQFGEQLNKVDFKVDRYILDRELSRNWDTVTQDWTPEANLTTFDRFDTAGYNFIGTVSIGTDLAFADVNNRTLEYINALGGLDGVIGNINNNTLIFVKQEDYSGPPGSSYATTNDAWTNYLILYDSAPYDQPGTEFDESVVIPTTPVNERMAVWRIAVDPITTIVTLTIEENTATDDYVQVERGNFYRSAQLYRPSTPGTGLTQISWLPLTTVVTEETIFDMGSVAFEEPVDMYDPTDRYDKYLVFPKANILV